MTINLTKEQERRIQAVINCGAYQSVEDVVEAALTAVEQRIVPGFSGTQEELDTLLAEGLASKEIAEEEFWGSGPAFVRVSYRQAASNDIVRQFRYYLVTLDLPEIAIRFRKSV